MKNRRKHIRPLILTEITLKEARIIYERHFNRELEGEKSYASAAKEVRDAIGTDEFFKRLVALRDECFNYNYWQCGDCGEIIPISEEHCPNNCNEGE